MIEVVSEWSRTSKSLPLGGLHRCQEWSEVIDGWLSPYENSTNTRVNASDVANCFMVDNSKYYDGRVKRLGIKIRHS